ncbi:MAG: hypothetical protein ACI9K2_007296, partial [Myxococcota bacterium]
MRPGLRRCATPPEGGAHSESSEYLFSRFFTLWLYAIRARRRHPPHTPGTGAPSLPGRRAPRQTSAWLEVHAGVTVAADDPGGRERLVRYTARAAVSLQRLSVDEDGRVCIRFKQ